jgi:hypothetical protein
VKLFISTLALSSTLVLIGCTGGPSERPQAGATGKAATNQGDAAKIEQNLAKLSSEDRKLAEAQRFCVIHSDMRLGEMGEPVKIMIKDQPVFLCCKGCQKKAFANEGEALAKAEELKAKVKGGG